MLLAVTFVWALTCTYSFDVGIGGAFATVSSRKTVLLKDTVAKAPYFIFIVHADLKGCSN
jgi:hypothetical protein